MLRMLAHFNLACGILFTLFYLYRIRYFWEGSKRLLKPLETRAAEHNHRLAVLIAARNEEQVLPHLLQSLQNQTYPKECFDIYVIADNCTDQTASLARQGGASVIERYNTVDVGKGYALDEGYRSILRSRGDVYEAYLVFDADNVLDPGYLSAMNGSLDQGHRIVTGFRNSKNYGTNWITAGYALWFLYEAVFLNLPRWILKRSCTVSGTGFMVHADVLRQNQGWPFHLLTEDVEFSVHCALHGETIAYCGEAMLYDEQPDTFRQSWRQRMRWCKGFYQVFQRYGLQLVRSVLWGKNNPRLPLLLSCAQSSYQFQKDCAHSGKRFGLIRDPLAAIGPPSERRERIICYDIFFTLAPAGILTIFSVLATLSVFLLSFTDLYSPLQAYDIQHLAPRVLLESFFIYYSVLFGIGLITMVACWKQVRTSAIRKILSLFTFPLFIYTYLPIALVALFRKVEWKPIHHSVAKSYEELLQE